MFTQQALHDFPLMTAKLFEGLEASAQADQISSMPQVSQAVPRKPEWCFIHHFVSTNSSPTPNLAACLS